MKLKRILIVTREIVPFHYGGIGTQFKSLAKFLRRLGHDVALLMERHANFEEAVFHRHYGDITVHFVEQLSSDSMTRQLTYAEEVAKVFDCLYESHRPDVVICADFEAECFFLLLKACSGQYPKTKFILNINGMTHDVLSVYEEDEDRFLKNSVLNEPNVRIICALEDLCIQLADELVPSTKIYGDQIHERLNIKRSMRPIPNFSDGNIFIPYSEGLKSETSSSKSKIIFVGRLDRMKGPDLLLKAYLGLSRDPAVKLPGIVFVGRDCSWKSYKETFLGYWRSRIPPEVSEKITFAGQVEHQRIADYLRDAAFCVFPSRWEPFGIVCLEAMGMGCPVVIPRGTGLEEVVGSCFPDGFFTHDMDGQNLAERMRFLLDHPPSPDARRALRQRALQLNEQAEKSWSSLIETDIDPDEKHAATAQWSGPILTLLSLLRLPKGHDPDHLQIYFSRKQIYEESDSIRIAYPCGKWETLTIMMSGGTGDRHLRLDPLDRPGEMLIREITLRNTQGQELWRADGCNDFDGCVCRENMKMIRQGELLLVSSADNDPQLFLACPTLSEPVTLMITLFSQLRH